MKFLHIMLLSVISEYPTPCTCVLRGGGKGLCLASGMQRSHSALLGRILVEACDAVPLA